jgi:hypothetical protein
MADHADVGTPRPARVRKKMEDVGVNRERDFYLYVDSHALFQRSGQGSPLVLGTILIAPSRT